MRKEERVKIAEDTLRKVEEGVYVNNDGVTIDLREEIRFAINGSKLYKPTEFVGLEQKVVSVQFQHQKTEIDVTNETTLSAAKKLAGNGGDVCCLNFASAKNPGGGFLTGSQAQEESLARSSALYPCIAPMQEMYSTNRHTKTCLYTDYMIYSPKVPVIKDDDGSLLATPYLCTFITAPAVNAGVVREREPENAQLINKIMMDRVAKVLMIAVDNGHDSLVLGAWGCGVFRNHPLDIAQCFKYHLLDNPLFKNRFKSVVFAVLDNSGGNIIGPFIEKLKTKE